MILCIADILPAELLEETRAVFACGRFQEGARTAGWHARSLKNNLQLDPAQPAVKKVQKKILAALWAHDLVRSSALPKAFRPLLFSRYETSMSYGRHVDDALMGGLDEMHSRQTRTDVSFTIFLNLPEEYEGGELVMESAAGEQSYKLPAGYAVFYPSTTLHRVNEITTGARLAVVGWLQSFVPDAAKREMLFELDAVRRAVFQREGKSAEFDTLAKVYSNLLRMWAEG
jgi:PKHD-type hydroxylase